MFLFLHRAHAHSQGTFPGWFSFLEDSVLSSYSHLEQVLINSLWVIHLLREWPGVRRETWAKAQETGVLGPALPPASLPRKCSLRSEDIIVLACKLRRLD